MASPSESPSSKTPASLVEEKPTREDQFRRGKRGNRAHSRGNQRGGTKGRGEGPGGRNKRPDMGRREWSRNPGDKRTRNDIAQQAAKYQKLNKEGGEVPIYAAQFSKEEIENEEKKPKRKVAVMIGNHRERTIEGDLFSAFVSAGAISKANGDDPKKSSLVRCARTDKGVHAAGNLISLKLIIEDPEIVQKINERLSPQIRVFGITRTNGSFSAYQFCDSRIYEYLIPTHAFLPPHPSSFLGTKLIELAEEADDLEGYRNRQSEVSTFWEAAENQYIAPNLEQLDPSIRHLVLEALYNSDASHSDNRSQVESKGQFNINPSTESGVDIKKSAVEHESKELDSLEVRDSCREPSSAKAENPARQSATSESEEATQDLNDTSRLSEDSTPELIDPSATDMAIKNLRAAYIGAKNSYRIHPERLARVRSVLSHFLGTQNFHNYTVQKNFRDPSAKRVMKSFVVHEQPLLINGTEWLSLKVHGQSFMMHQIRKMVSMAALVVRCGCHEGRLQDSFLQDRLSIPKAPGLGLLLERPVFDSYNEKLVGQFGRESIDFRKFEREMQEFKQGEIYERIFREEERDHQFHTFFASIDNLKSSQLLYLSSIGVPATSRPIHIDSSKPEVEKRMIEGLFSEDEAGNEDDG